MPKNLNSVLTGSFFTKETAEKAFQAALDVGYLQNEIDVIMTEPTMKKFYENDLQKLSPLSTSSKATQGGVIGGVTGGMIGLLAILGANLLVPGLGLVIAGPLSGAVAGTLMGTLVALELSEIQAQEYEEKLKKGAIILSVKQKFQSNLEHIWRELERSE